MINFVCMVCVGEEVYVDSLMWVLELNPGVVQKQQALWTAEPALGPTTFILKGLRITPDVFPLLRCPQLSPETGSHYVALGVLELTL